MNEQELLHRIDQLHTTQMGIERIRKNLQLDCDDVVTWCKEAIMDTDSCIIRKGKNWYILVHECVLTVNAYSLTIITAHRYHPKKHTFFCE